MHKSFKKENNLENFEFHNFDRFVVCSTPDSLTILQYWKKERKEERKGMENRAFSTLHHVALRVSLSPFASLLVLKAVF